MIANFLAYSSKNHFRVDVPPLNSSKELQNLHPCWWLLYPQCPKVKPCLLPPRRLVFANDLLRWACSSASHPGSGDDLYLVSMSWLRSVGLGGCWGSLKGVWFPFFFHYNVGDDVIGTWSLVMIPIFIRIKLLYFNLLFIVNDLRRPRSTQL